MSKVKVCEYTRFWMTCSEMRWLVWSEFEFISFDHSERRALSMFRQRAIPRTLSTKFRIVIHSLEIRQLEMSVSYPTIHLISEQVIQNWMYSHTFTLLKEEANTYKTTMCCVNVSNSSVYIYIYIYICVVFYSHTSKIT